MIRRTLEEAAKAARPVRFRNLVILDHAINSAARRIDRRSACGTATDGRSSRRATPSVDALAVLEEIGSARIEKIASSTRPREVVRLHPDLRRAAEAEVAAAGDERD
jgi:hypothetical protein